MQDTLHISNNNFFVYDIIGIPAHLIKSIDMYLSKESKISMLLYDPIVPIDLEMIYDKCKRSKMEYSYLTLLNTDGASYKKYKIQINNFEANMEVGWLNDFDGLKIIMTADIFSIEELKNKDITIN